MNHQEIFDKVYKHLLAQGQRSRLANGINCAYRGTDGMKCAVGCLIDDKHYHQSIEKASVHAPLVQGVLVDAGVLESMGDDKTVELLSRLQSIHDMAPIDFWSGRLAQVAAMYGLTIPELP